MFARACSDATTCALSPCIFALLPLWSEWWCVLTTYLIGWLVSFFTSATIFGKSISNLSSTSRTPSFVTSAVVLPGTKSLWMTKRSSVILIVLSFDGALPSCACRYATHSATAIAPASNRRAVDLFFMGESIYSGNVDQARQTTHPTASHTRRRGRASAPRV